MKHTGARILLFLLIGAVINVAVAWACVLSPRPNSQWSESTDAIRYRGVPEIWGQPTFRALLRTPGRTTIFGRWLFYALPDGHPIMSADERWQLLYKASNRSQDLDLARLAIAHRTDLQLTAAHFAINRCGVPFAAMECFEIMPAASAAPAETLRHFLPSWAEGFPLEVSSTSGVPDGRSLPLRPVLPGFVSNTLFYSVLLACVRFGLLQHQFRRRRRRGLCPHCAYPIGTSVVCTECGKPVRPCPGAPA